MKKPIEMVKTNKHSTTKKKTAKSCPPHEHIIADRLSAEEGMFFFRQIPLSETIANKLANELIQYAQDESEAFTLNRFYKKKGISKRTFNHWCTKFPCLKAAKETAKEHIADNREIGALKRTLDTNAVYKKQAVYDEEYKKETIRIADLRNKEEIEKEQEINIYMDGIKIKKEEIKK